MNEFTHFFFSFGLAGLAASLQQRVLAQMKIKEENDERQKRTEVPPIHNGNVTITPAAHIKTEGMFRVSIHSISDGESSIEHDKSN